MIRDPEEALGDALPGLQRAIGPCRAIGGWATVDLDRAGIEVGAALVAKGLGAGRIEPAADDALLGAHCRMFLQGGSRDVLLLEPSTEGRLAAALARHGEGPVALYLLVDRAAEARARAAGFRLSSEALGPLGPERLVLGGPRWGPFLLLAGLD